MQVSLTVENPDANLLNDFKMFVKYVLGVDEFQSTIVRPAKIYRAGIANAADRGLDMWANFGAIVQVKHLRLDKDWANDISERLATDEVVIVCKTAESQLIHFLLNQIGKPIRGIITQEDLLDWYDLCLKKYQNRMGNKLLKHLQNEFLQEFPSLGEILSFLDERSYSKNQLVGIWKLGE